jgi:hypothetical protein
MGTCSMGAVLDRLPLGIGTVLGPLAVPFVGVRPGVVAPDLFPALIRPCQVGVEPAAQVLCVETLHDLLQLAGIPDLLLKFGHCFGQIAHFASSCLGDRQVSLKLN